jgi:hypothetical protein
MSDSNAILEEPLANSQFVDPFPVKESSSSVMKQKIKSGTHDFADDAFLVPHEFVRLEMTRLERVLPFFDPEKHAWKARCMHTWLSKFFIPAIYDVSNYLLILLAVKCSFKVLQYDVYLLTVSMTAP